MSGYLLDTCIVRRWYGGNAVAVSRMQSLPAPAPLYISAITRGEIEFAHTNVASDKARQAEFRTWLRETFEVPELTVSGYTADEYAKFRRRLFDRFDKKGKYTENREDKLGQKVGIDENDLWLLAQACERKLIFITGDDMTRINDIVDQDVRVEYWPQQ